MESSLSTAHEILMIDRNDVSYPTYTYKQPTPDGTVYVVLTEDPVTEKLTQVFIHLGKSGTLTRAWSEALASIMNLAILNGARTEDIVAAISNITTGRRANDGTVSIRSGPEGVARAMLHYNQLKSKQMELMYKIQKRKGLRWSWD